MEIISIIGCVLLILAFAAVLAYGIFSIFWDISERLVSVI